VDGLSEPMEPRTRALLRQAVRDHARGEQRRRHPPTLRAGVPGRRVASLELGPADAADPGLRTDVVAALRVRAGADPEQIVWLARCGGLELQDVDFQWMTATRAACVEAGEESVPFVVVNRRGWRDPRSGLGRTWARVRPAPRN